MKSKLEEIFSRYSWGASYEVKELPPFFVTIEFPNCCIKFYHNCAYGGVECYIYKPNSRFGDYELREVLHVIDKTNHVRLLSYIDGVTTEECMNQYVKIIHDDLNKVINGDFSWQNEVDEIRNNTKLISEVLFRHNFFSRNKRITDSEIYNKMMRGDESWKTDLESMDKGGAA